MQGRKPRIEIRQFVVVISDAGDLFEFENRHLSKRDKRLFGIPVLHLLPFGHVALSADDGSFSLHLALHLSIADRPSSMEFGAHSRGIFEGARWASGEFVNDE